MTARALRMGASVGERGGGDTAPARSGRRSTSLITTLIELHQQGRFPFDELVTHFAFEDFAEAMRAAEAGEGVKPVPRMP